MQKFDARVVIETRVNYILARFVREFTAGDVTS